MSKLLIGIDPGKNTGLAAWDLKAKALHHYGQSSAIHAQTKIIELSKEFEIFVILEDSRLNIRRKDASSMHRLKGAGDIAGQCRAWVEFLEYYGIKYERRAAGQTYKGRLKRDYFQKITGISTLVKEDHIRDAVMMVWDENETRAKLMEDKYFLMRNAQKRPTP
jgi:hypothetical protein